MGQMHSTISHIPPYPSKNKFKEEEEDIYFSIDQFTQLIILPPNPFTPTSLKNE